MTKFSIRGRFHIAYCNKEFKKEREPARREIAKEYYYSTALPIHESTRKLPTRSINDPIPSANTLLLTSTNDETKAC